jgi:hypothetical protein
LLDFGLAVLRDESAGGSLAAQAPTATESATRAGEILGTRPYIFGLCGTLALIEKLTC